MLKYFTKPRTKYKSVIDKEYGVSGFIPYKYLWNERTVITHNDWFFQVIKVKGYSFETADDEDVDIRKNVRNTLWKGISSGNFGLYFHIIRRKKDVYEGDDISSEIENSFAKNLDETWKKKNSIGNIYINDLYVTIIRKSSGIGIQGVEESLGNLLNKADKSRKKTYLREMYTDLEEMVSRVTTALHDYGPTVLGLKRNQNGTFSELLTFLGMIVNSGEYYDMLVPSIPINYYIARNRLFFGKRSVESRGIGSSRYCGVVSIREYGPKTNAGMMDGFLQMPFECIVSQSFLFTSRSVAIQQMTLQKNRMIQSEDKAVSQVAEIDIALDMAMSGTIAFGKHHVTVLCIEDNLKALENSLSLASVELSNTGAISCREQMNLEPSYWAQLPCNYDYLVRDAIINSLNLVSFVSLHNFPIGKAKDNFWGDAVTVFSTTSGTPFFFSFHVRDVGHTTIIGPTGAGKTVLMNFLCAQSLKFKPKMFFFDKDRGAEIFLRAINGVYTVIEPSSSCGFNPLQLDDTAENRTFIMDWLKSLVTVNGEKILAEDQDIISRAVEGNYKLEQKDRILRNLIPFFGLEGPGTLAGRLAMWHGEGSHAGVFDNEIDSLDFSVNTIFGFEMAELLKDKVSLAPVLLYLFHKINLSLDGTPTMIILDEAWALIDNPVFAPKIKDWLKVLRKLNAMVIFATQSVEDASKSSISDTLIQQTSTQIFLPNLKAKASGYMDAFMLSRREYTIIKTTDPSTRFFIIKQGTDAVVARLDLSGMTEYINVLSGNAASVRLLDSIRAEVGDDPKHWMGIFLERLSEL